MWYTMRMNWHIHRVAAATGACALMSVAMAAAGDTFSDMLEASVLTNAPAGWLDMATATFRRLSAADRAVDAKWAGVGGVAEYDALRREVRARAIDAMGGFPLRTPLDPKVVARVRRAGYSVEKVWFSSRPGIPVTALVFLPNSAKFKPPYPAVVVACGHDGSLGKLNGGYQRGCILAARAGMAAIIYDPIEQGERAQTPRIGNTDGHNAIGVRELLLGGSMAMVRLWDGMRAIDYLETRPDVDKSRIGVMGNSGGGTLSSYIAAFDERVKAGAPSCYISSLREVCGAYGPQDAEQNIFGSLSYGLNHAALMLLNANAMCACFSTEDFFPYKGSLETFDVAKRAAERAGRADAVSMIESLGPHGWKESSRTGSVAWMRRWLLGDLGAVPFDMKALQALDEKFDPKAVDMGFGPEDGLVTATGNVQSLPGSRMFYALQSDRLAAFESMRSSASREGRVAAALRLSGASAPEKGECEPVEASKREFGGGVALSLAFRKRDGSFVPVVAFLPGGAPSGAVVFCGDATRAEWAERARAAFKAGNAVAVVDLAGYGEASVDRRWYPYRAVPADGPAVMLNLLGEHMVAYRVRELLAVAEFLRGRTGRVPSLCAAGDAAIPAAHAFACFPGKFSSVELLRRPPSWAEAVRNPAAYRLYPFANVVKGALKEYDWTELLPE